MFLAIAINDTISKDQNYSSGVEILKNMENKSFSSKIMQHSNFKKKSRTTSSVVTILVKLAD